MSKPAVNDEFRGRTDSRIAHAQQQEDARAMSVLRLLSVGAVFTLFGIGAKAYIVGHTFHGFVLWFFGVLIGLNYLHFNKNQNENFFKNVFLSNVGLLFIYLVASGGESNTGPLWFYVFPSLVLYLLGLKTGLTLIAICFSVIVLIFRFPELPFVTTTYDTDFQIRFIASLCFVSVFAYVLDSSRRVARNELIDMARLYEHAARTDELTGLSNRRDMKSQLDNEFYRFQRHNRYFSVILMDIDHFKRINDHYGHDAGDLVLEHFARLLKELSRKVDIVSRWGGEEFLMLLPDTSLVQALATAERLRKKVEDYYFKYNGQRIHVTMSAGVCSINQTKDLNILLKQTDINLYEAKHLGRNRIMPAVKSSDDSTTPNPSLSTSEL